MKKNLAITFAIAIVAILAIVACSNSVVAKSKVATPIIVPADRSVITTSTKISLSSSAGATIYYTTDGTNPTTNSQKYDEDDPFEVSGEVGDTVKIMAMATLDGYEASDFAKATYTIGSEPKPVDKSSIEIAAGQFRVHFAEPQNMERHSFTYDDERITVVDYYTCSTAEVVIKDLPATSALYDHIELISLVATGDASEIKEAYENGEGWQDFAIAITTHGSLVELVRGVLSQVLDLVSVDVDIDFGDKYITIHTSGTDITLPINITPVSTTGSINLNFYKNWDGLAFSPIYLTEDLYGLLLSALAGDVKGLVDVGTCFNVYYKLTGKSILEKYKVFDKVDPFFYAYKGFDKGVTKYYFAKQFVGKEWLEAAFPGKQLFKDNDPIIDEENVTTRTDTDYGTVYDREYYDYDYILIDDRTSTYKQIVVKVRDFVTNSDWRTRSDIGFDDAICVSKTPIGEDNEEEYPVAPDYCCGLEKDVTYIIHTTEGGGMLGSTFAVKAEEPEEQKYYVTVDNDNLGRLNFVLAKKDECISGFYGGMFSI